MDLLWIVALVAIVCYLRPQLLTPFLPAEPPAYRPSVPSSGQAVEALSVVRSRLMATGLPKADCDAQLDSIAALLVKEP